MVNVLVMLDDFTAENGATFLLPCSHMREDKPSDQEFYRDALQTTGSQGDVVIFNSNVWHAAGINRSQKERRALTLTFTKPFMKQQLDYPRAFGYDRMREFGEEVRQMLGYNSRVPENLDEWYQPMENRFYKKNQE